MLSRMKRSQAAISSDGVRLDLTIPASWSELSDMQLRYIFSLMNEGYSSVELKMLFLLRFSGCKVIGRGGLRDEGFLILKGRDYFLVTPLQFAEVLPALEWLDEIPQFPVRLSSWGGAPAVDACLQGVPFESYIIVENLFQGYISRQDDSFLRQIADVLYPAKWWRRLRRRQDPVLLLSVFFWVSSIKKFLAEQFSDFFQPVKEESSNLLEGSRDVGSQLRDAMNAQIRALTKGDVTKEAEILRLDTWRALTELNAQAREYAELNAKIKS